MAELIVYRGSGKVTVIPKSETCFLYRIGSGQVDGGNFIQLNDQRRLNTLAEEIRDEYCEWIYSLNRIFTRSDLIHDDLSLFFLTDVSCKRSERFESFDLILCLLLIREKIVDVKLTSVQLIGFDAAFERAFCSFFCAKNLSIISPVGAQFTGLRRLLADGLYVVRSLGVVISNKFNRADKTKKINGTQKRLFFSIYPQMFSEGRKETKYGRLVDDDENYVVSILTDGMHQIASFRNYIKWKREAEKMGMLVVDSQLRLSDVLVGCYWYVRLSTFAWRQRNESHQFKGIDVTGFLKVELLYSLSRVMRLCVLRGAFYRFFYSIDLQEIVFYPFEYPLGRLISYVINAVDPTIARVGYQMGPVSPRRLEQFMAIGEGSAAPPFSENAPIPDRIMVEDEEAAKLYRSVGYNKVQIMEKVFRYEYLDSVRLERREDTVLIAPGLHDGSMMLEHLLDEIEHNPETTYYLKTHPRADNHYVDRYSKLRNLKIADQSIADLLAQISRVIVTYSSVGLEADRLGLIVTVMSIPGRVNTSPLLNRKN